MTNRTLTLAFAAMATLASAPAMASDWMSPRSVEVTYADLDLATAKGVAEFDRRLDRAAREVCGADASANSRIPSSDSRACYRETRSQLETPMAAIIAAHSRG